MVMSTPVSINMHLFFILKIGHIFLPIFRDLCESGPSTNRHFDELPYFFNEPGKTRV